MKPLLTYIFFIVSASCVKDQSSQNYNPSFKIKVNGQKQSIAACGSSAHVAEYLKDTAIFVGFGCGGQRIGFYLKGDTKDGVYQLDHKNQAWYEGDHILYKTDSLRKGTLTIKTGSYQAPNGIFAFIEGVLAFEAINESSGRIVKLTDGRFQLRKYTY